MIDDPIAVELLRRLVPLYLFLVHVRVTNLPTEEYIFRCQYAHVRSKKTFIELERQIQFVPCLCSLPFLFLFVVNGLLFAGMLELAHNDLVRR